MTKFINAELKRNGKSSFIPVLESFILWSRTAEKALNNPGNEYTVKLCRKPEVLDELADVPVQTFLNRYPDGRIKNYRIFFDGDELYIN